jgi:hypothetical protein
MRSRAASQRRLTLVSWRTRWPISRLRQSPFRALNCSASSRPNVCSISPMILSACRSPWSSSVSSRRTFRPWRARFFLSNPAPDHGTLRHSEPSRVAIPGARPWPKPSRVIEDVIEQRFVIEATGPLYYHRLVAIAKDPTPRLMPQIEAARHGILQPLHSSYQVRLRRLDHEMVGIAQQYPAMDSPARPGAGFLQSLEKSAPICTLTSIPILLKKGPPKKTQNLLAFFPEFCWSVPTQRLVPSSHGTSFNSFTPPRLVADDIKIDYPAEGRFFPCLSGLPITDGRRYPARLM